MNNPWSNATKSTSRHLEDAKRENGNTPPTTTAQAVDSAPTCSSLEDAIGKVVRCTDGYTRRLEKVDDRLGYYAVPIEGDTWMDLSGTYIWQCREMFIGGEIVEGQTINRLI